MTINKNLHALLQMSATSLHTLQSLGWWRRYNFCVAFADFGTQMICLQRKGTWLSHLKTFKLTTATQKSGVAAEHRGRGARFGGSIKKCFDWEVFGASGSFSILVLLQQIFIITVHTFCCILHQIRGFMWQSLWLQPHLWDSGGGAITRFVIITITFSGQNKKVLILTLCRLCAVKVFAED